MEGDRICAVALAVAAIVLAILDMVRKHRLAAQARKTLVYREVVEALKETRTITRESLITEVRKRLSVISPGLPDSTYEVSTAISKLIADEPNLIREEKGILYAKFPPDG